MASSADCLSCCCCCCAVGHSGSRTGGRVGSGYSCCLLTHLVSPVCIPRHTLIPMNSIHLCTTLLCVLLTTRDTIAHPSLTRRVDSPFAHHPPHSCFPRVCKRAEEAPRDRGRQTQPPTEPPADAVSQTDSRRNRAHASHANTQKKQNTPPPPPTPHSETPTRGRQGLVGPRETGRAALSVRPVVAAVVEPVNVLTESMQPGAGVSDAGRGGR